MFPNAVMMKQKTWNDILGAMVTVRDAHGWASVERLAKPERNRGSMAQARRNR